MKALEIQTKSSPGFGSINDWSEVDAQDPTNKDLVKFEAQEHQFDRINTNLDEFYSNLETTADIFTDFIPVIGSGKDIYKGIKGNNYWQIGLGVGGLVLDAVTFGSISIVKGGLKRIGREGIEQLGKEGIEQSVKKSSKTAGGLGESLIKPERRTGFKVDAVGTKHSKAREFRQGSGKIVESAHLVPSSAVKHLQNYSRSKAMTLLLPKKLHMQFDAKWMSKIRELRRSGINEISVAEWKGILSEAANSVEGLKGRMADTMDFIIDVEFYDVLRLSPYQMLPLPKL